MIRPIRTQVVDGLDEQVHDHPRLAAGRNRSVLGLLDRFLPIAAKPHLARRLQHLLIAPGKLLLGERDQLLRRVGNHGLRQILDEAFAATRGAWNPARVGLPRRIGIELQVGARDLGLRGPANEEIVDLRVSRQLIEVERLQCRQPARIKRRVAHGTTGGTAPAATAAGTAETRNDVAHFVLGQGDDLGQIGDIGELQLRSRGDRVGGRRRGGDLQSLRGDRVAEQRRIVLERLVDLGVGHPHPPGEERVVAVVEVEPLGRDRAQLLDRGGTEHRLLAVHPGRRGGQARNLFRDVGDRRGGVLGVHVLDPDPRLDERHELRRERHDGHRLGHRQGIGVEPREVARDRGLEAVEVCPGRRAELRGVETRECRLPVRVETPQTREPRRRERHERRRSRRGHGLPAPPPTAPPTAGGAIGVVARERRPIQVVAQDHHPHLALRSSEERRQVERNGLVLRLRARTQEWAAAQNKKERRGGQKGSASRHDDRSPQAQQLTSTWRERRSCSVDGDISFRGLGDGDRGDGGSGFDTKARSARRRTKAVTVCRPATGRVRSFVRLRDHRFFVSNSVVFVPPGFTLATLGDRAGSTRRQRDPAANRSDRRRRAPATRWNGRCCRPPRRGRTGQRAPPRHTR